MKKYELKLEVEIAIECYVEDIRRKTFRTLKAFIFWSRKNRIRINFNQK